MVHNTKKNHYAFRDGDWLLINAKSGYLRKAPAAWNQKYEIPEDDDLPVELYNLREDIGQKNNLAAQYPERVAAMQALLNQVRESTYPELD
jgi:arylsulfatase A